MTTEDEDRDRHDLAECQTGDESAFQRLYTRHAGRIYGLALRTMRREDQAEDVVQVTFMQLHKKAHTFRGEAKLSTWLSAIAINACRMKLRKQKHRTVSLDQAAELPSNEPPRRETGLIEALDAIEQPTRELLLLAAQGHSYDELGGLLDLSADQVRGRLYRARKVLVVQMRQMGLKDV